MSRSISRHAVVSIGPKTAFIIKDVQIFYPRLTLNIIRGNYVIRELLNLRRNYFLNKILEVLKLTGDYIKRGY